VDLIGHTFFAALERFGVESFLALAVALWDFACEFPFVREDCFLVEGGHEDIELTSRHVDKSVVVISIQRALDDFWRGFRLVHSPDQWLCR